METNDSEITMETNDSEIILEKNHSETIKEINSSQVIMEKDDLSVSMEKNNPELVELPELFDLTEIEEIQKKKMPAWMRITIAAVAAIVILFAVIWEVAYNVPQEEHIENAPPRARSEVQDEIRKLDWIIPAFLPINEYSRPGTQITQVNGIVIHYIGNPDTTAERNRSYFANLAITGETYASSNFIICLDGQILQCVPVDEIAYASNYRNADTISIELCHPDDTGQFTDETYASAVRLTAWLCKQYGLTSDEVLRHFDVYGKECPKYFVDNEDAWETFKADVAQAIEQSSN